MAEETRVVMQDIDVEGIASLATYEKHGGYAALKKALKEMTPDSVIAEVKKSNLRGKGGAGFPAGAKWGFIPKCPGEKYLCVNADESEPGTFKDQMILEKIPHRMIEGAVIAGYAFCATHMFVYARGEFWKEIRIVQQAVDEAYKAGYLGKGICGGVYSLECTVHPGAGAYICGEETSLLESLEGKRAEPKMKPPFPAIKGLYEKPTIINNVETLATVPAIIERGADWHLSLGTEKSPGIKMFSVSGHVNKPGVYEIEYGVNQLDFIETLCGGVKSGKLKAIIPGGSSVPVMPAANCDCPLSYEGLVEAGSMLGSAGMIVFNDRTDMVKVIEVISRFYAHESCGKCTVCREGTHWMNLIVNRILRGEGSVDDLTTLKEAADGIEMKSFCPFGDAAAWPVQSFLKHFRHEFMDYIEGRKKLLPKYHPCGMIGYRTLPKSTYG
jgi:NADH-quinone oxidoreductase subunit F